MNLYNVANIRANNQKIFNKSSASVPDVVKYITAIQAQDYNMVKWAVGVRSKNITENDVNNAINNREIIRTHLMRPTWHLVSANDIYWLLDLTAPKIISTLRTRLRDLGLTTDILNKSLKILERELSENNYLTRDQIKSILKSSKINTGENRLSHILMYAELNKLICNGDVHYNKVTYSLLEERVPKSKTFNKNESLFNLANRYFTTRGPATIADFTWWSGLNISEAKIALELCKDNLISENLNGKEYWFSESSDNIPEDYYAYLLPAFDEFILSYTDRTAYLPHEYMKNAVYSNGIFRPVILLNGKIIGIWSRKIKKEKVIISIKYFEGQGKSNNEKVKNAAQNYSNFLGLKLEFIHKD